MDSNTICFSMLPTPSLTMKSPSMIDESKSCKSKSTDESTNFIDFQQFKTASNVSCSTIDCDHESLPQSSILPHKTKIIQKHTHPKKQSEKQDQNESDHTFSICPSRNPTNENPHVRKTKNSDPVNAKSTQKKPVTVKSHSFASIFDWMMEIASIMKLSRTVFYRACNIFYESYKKDQRVLENSNVQKYVCACLHISAKLEISNVDFMQELFQINKKRIPKQAINDAETSIYRILNWKIPLHNLISEQVIEVFQKWNNYLERCEKLGMIRKDTQQRLTLSLKYLEKNPLKNKTFGQILYLLDIMLLNQAKKFMNAPNLQNQEKTFITPIIMGMYAVFTIQNGDPQNTQQFFLPLFKSFLRQGLERPAVQIDRFSKQVQLSFMVFNFDSHLSKIPLTKDWKDVIERDVLTYLPVNVLKRTDRQ